ncbi:MAG: regulatory protein RecX [Fidelibacterota bacterium]
MGKAKLSKIVAIQTQGRRKKRRTIRLDTGDVFGISEDVFLSSGLGVGDGLTPAAVNELIAKDEMYQVQESALHLLGYRQRSRGELRRRLLQKKYPANVVDRVLDKLEEKKYINDEEFAFQLAREKTKNKLIGPFALRVELKSFALSADLVEKAITKTYEELPMETLLDSLLAKRHIKKGTALTDKEKQRLRDFLYRKGYPWEVIEATFQRYRLL